MAKFIGGVGAHEYGYVRVVADDGSSHVLWAPGRLSHRRSGWKSMLLAARMLCDVRGVASVPYEHSMLVAKDLLSNLPPEGWEMEVGWFREWCRAMFGEEGEEG